MMKQRAGLGKKVSSIFDGVPLPKAGQQVEQAPPRAVPPVVPPQRPADADALPRQMPAAPPEAPSPHKPADAPNQHSHVPVTPQTPKPAPVAPPRTVPVQAPQPRISEPPLPKKAVGVPAAGGGAAGDWHKLIHKIFFSGNGEADARNKKAAALVGVLSVVLAVVVMWTWVFSASSAKNSAAGRAVTTAASEVRINWTPPEPYPINFRDPMQAGSTISGSGSDFYGSGRLIVKAIVLSDDPTAVINGQIVRQGQTINGTKVIKINKDSVEFEADGKSWKQQVE
jgi:hypothetical protein